MKKKKNERTFCPTRYYYLSISIMFYPESEMQEKPSRDSEVLIFLPRDEVTHVDGTLDTTT